MLKIENVEVLGWGHAIRGMRNPKNSWAKSDSGPECPYGKEKCCGECQQNFCIGPNDNNTFLQNYAAGIQTKGYFLPSIPKLWHWELPEQYFHLPCH